MGIAAALAYQASFLVYQSVWILAFGTFMFGRFRSVGDEFLQCPFDAVFPGINGIHLKMEFGDDVDHERQRHSMP